MKLTVMALAMGLCTAGAALHAQPTGTIRFFGLIVQGTCADALVMTHSPEPQQSRNRCKQSAGGVGAAHDVAVYTEHRTTVSTHSGIDLLDYYVDVARSRAGAQVQLVTRNYS